MQTTPSPVDKNEGKSAAGIVSTLAARLEGIRRRLSAVPDGGRGMTGPTKGQERELFVRDCLALVMPSGVRFGTGEIIDIHGCNSGQIDIVLEFPFSPSLALADRGPRLYFAEGVGAVLEVKSDIQKDWRDVISKAEKVAALRRKFDQSGLAPYGMAGERIPFFAVGYRGWSNKDELSRAINGTPISGLFVVEPGLFVTGEPITHAIRQGGEWWKADLSGTEEYSLLFFVFALHRALTAVVANSASLLPYLTCNVTGLSQ